MKPHAIRPEAGPQQAAALHEELFLFDIPVPKVLAFLARATGEPLAVTEAAADWHVALRDGFHGRLHINLGIPGIEEPEHPIEENAAALYAALLLGAASIPVILSGELERAVHAGLITRRQLAAHERAWALVEAGLTPRIAPRRAGASMARRPAVAGRR